ncbi:O-fucosyltransferase 15-like protein, partial [Drosera capensis]
FRKSSNLNSTNAHGGVKKTNQIPKSHHHVATTMPSTAADPAPSHPSCPDPSSSLKPSTSFQFDTSSSFVAFLSGDDSSSSRGKKRKNENRRRWRGGGRGGGVVLVVVGLVCVVCFGGNWLMICRIGRGGGGLGEKIGTEKKDSIGAVVSKLKANVSWSGVGAESVEEDLPKIVKLRKPLKTPYGRLLAMAAHSLAEKQYKPEPRGLWEQPHNLASTWKPCSEQRDWPASEGNNGYIMVTANGGLNQQRVAICNAVAVARLLNATLVVPKFMYSSVWRDVSDIYQEEHFITYLRPDVRIVKELPRELQSLDLEAIGSVVRDDDTLKEAKPSFFRKYIKPLLLQNRVVHFIGFANRLAFDPIPFQLQRLRCRCNFHALQFVPKIQETGMLILQRMRQNSSQPGPLDQNLVGPYAKVSKDVKRPHAGKASRYLALHLRFEIDMVAHSLCEFGGGEEERRELEAYRQIHFPALTLINKSKKLATNLAFLFGELLQFSWYPPLNPVILLMSFLISHIEMGDSIAIFRLPSPAVLREEGLCPLAPEEAGLMLAALGFNRKTYIFLAGAQIYGGRSRLAALSNLYPNLVTKEDLLSPSEIAPFSNFSSQLATLDFIGCSAASAFAMTDSGSQLSALVSGYRIYYGGGEMMTIRPNKRRLANIFLKNSTIEWKIFEQRVRKAVRQTKQIHSRPLARSIYRHPCSKECMCHTE